MKARTLVFVALLCGNALVSASALAGATPPISKVVVYADRAQITRTADVACAAGKAEAAFPDLPVGIDVRTLRADAAGKARAIGVTSRVEPRAEDRDARVAGLIEEMKAVDAELAALRDRQQSKAERRTMSNQYGAYFRGLWGEELRNPNPSAARWDGVLNGLRAENLAVAEANLQTTAERRVLARKKDALTRRLSHLKRDAVPEGLNARVAVDCAGAARARVSLVYVTPGATWHPEYDLRFVPAGGRDVKFGKGKAELTVAAVIQQSTGEDWQDAKILLSTAKPRLGAEAPKPARLMVDGHKASEQKVLVEATEKRETLQTGKQQAGAQGPQAAALEDRGQSFALTLPGAVTVHADGRPYWFPVDTTSAQAELVLVSVPKLSPWVYHVVKLDNPASYPLLPGKLHAFRRGSFVGDTALEYKAPGEPMEISLGIDEELEIERIDLADKRKKAGFLSNTKHIERAYRVEVTNGSRLATKVQVRERIPVSKVEDVKVELNKDKTTGGFELDGHRGIIEWLLDLKSGATGKVDLYYAIHLPEDWQVNIR